MTKLSIITVAYNNRAGIEQTFNSLDYIDDKDMPSIEWVVIDGGSTDGTYDYLCTLKSKIAIKYLSEKDQGIYDAMNKGILMSSGDYALFLNSGDTLVPEANEIIHELCDNHFRNNIYIYDAILDFGYNIKKIRRAKSCFYIYHSLPASHQAIVYPLLEIKDVLYDLRYKVSSDYALTAMLYKKGIPFIKAKRILSCFSIGGVSTTNSRQLCEDAMKVQKNILHLPSVLIYLSYFARKLSTRRAKNTWESGV